MAVHPLRPATRRYFGGPLPRQLVDRIRAPPPAHYCFNLSAYGVLAEVSLCCPPLMDSFSYITHPSAAMKNLPVSPLSNFTAQLACVTHAASVYPEPGSNSQLKLCEISDSWLVVRIYKNLHLICILTLSIYSESVIKFFVTFGYSENLVISAGVLLYSSSFSLELLALSSATSEIIRYFSHLSTKLVFSA